jgi:hypothetical protein
VVILPGDGAGSGGADDDIPFATQLL